MKNDVTYTSRSLGDTFRLAAELLQRLRPGTVLALHGDLGAGKTCFVQGLARAMGVRGAVNSPTFTLVNEHEGRALRLYHIDLYRIGGPEEALGIGLDEYMEAGGITAIEWAERALPLLPRRTLHLRFEAGDDPAERRTTCVEDGAA